MKTSLHANYVIHVRSKVQHIWMCHSDRFVPSYISLLTYLVTPWSRVLLEKLTGSAASQEIPHILWNPKVHYRTHKGRQLSLSWANSIQSPNLPPTSWKSVWILSSHLRLGLPSRSFPQVSPPEPCAHLSPSPNMPHAPPISFFSILPPAQYWVRITDH